MADNSLQSRPYRSHRVPACIRCRSRKIRCVIDLPGNACLACRTAPQPKKGHLKCQYIHPSANSSPSDSQPTSKRRRLSGDDDDDEHVPVRPSSAPVLHKSSTHPSASIILAPHIAEDVSIISQHPNADPSASQPYQTMSRDVQNPIVYLTVPRFRTGLAPELGAGRDQLEIIQQLTGPFKRNVLDLYLDHVHPSFPILDGEMCAMIRKGQTDSLPNNVLCVVYAMGLAHWSFSDTLKMHARPDMHFVWNKAGPLQTRSLSDTAPMLTRRDRPLLRSWTTF